MEFHLILFRLINFLRFSAEILCIFLKCQIEAVFREKSCPLTEWKFLVNLKKVFKSDFSAIVDGVVLSFWGTHASVVSFNRHAIHLILSSVRGKVSQIHPETFNDFPTLILHRHVNNLSFSHSFLSLVRIFMLREKCFELFSHSPNSKTYTNTNNKLQKLPWYSLWWILIKVLCSRHKLCTNSLNERCSGNFINLTIPHTTHSHWRLLFNSFSCYKKLLSLFIVTFLPSKYWKVYFNPFFSLPALSFKLLSNLLINQITPTPLSMNVTYKKDSCSRKLRLKVFPEILRHLKLICGWVFGGILGEWTEEFHAILICVEVWFCGHVVSYFISYMTLENLMKHVRVCCEFFRVVCNFPSKIDFKIIFTCWNLNSVNHTKVDKKKLLCGMLTFMTLHWTSFQLFSHLTSIVIAINSN